MLEERLQSAFTCPLVVQKIHLAGFYLDSVQFLFYIKESKKFQGYLG